MPCHSIHITQPSDELLKRFDDMEFVLNLRKKSSKQQSMSKTAKEGSDLSQSIPCPRDPQKLKPKFDVGQQRSHKVNQDVVGKFQHRESAKGSSTQPDELVKYMSNLPGFLKSCESGENVQRKALNVGVLDWSQLEKWKNKQRHVKEVVGSNFTSFNSCGESSSRAATTTSCNNFLDHNTKKLDGRKGLSSSSIKGSYKEGLPKSSKISSQKVKRSQYPLPELKTLGEELGMKIGELKTLGEELGITPLEFEPSSKTQSDTSLRRVERNDYDEISTRVGNFASKSRHHSGRSDETKKSMKGLQQHRLEKKERNLKSISDKGLQSLESKNKGVAFDSQNNMSSGKSEAKKKLHQWQELDIDVDHKQSHRMPRNIVLLRPRRALQSSSDDYFQHSQSRTSSDEDFSESSRSSSSYISLPEEAYTEDVHSEIPHSSVMSSVSEQASSSETLQASINNDLDVDLSAVVSKKPTYSDKMSSLQSEDTCTENDVLDFKLRNQCNFSNMKESQEHGTDELTTQNSLSHRRPSFSLNRIGRSFSFREGSSLLKLGSNYDSAKSCSVTSESSCLDNFGKDKVKGHNRTRSSPLLKLLDPILKHNKAPNMSYSSEHSETPKGSMNSASFRTINEEKSMESPIQALLQLTIKNGLPLFRFVLNSERKVLVATMKSLALPEKDDFDCYFTFYLVNEIKKKSSKWKSHWNKGKNCEYAYNFVGQMKVSSSKVTESRNPKSKRECVEKEYVLMGVENDQPDQGTPNFMKSKELAAVVSEIPCDNINDEGLLCSHDFLKKGCLKCLADERCFCSSQENDMYGSITVILPGGVHSSPSTGEPSPLIHRWKLGGSCDCGGWDVGCKMLVLSNQTLNSNTPSSPRSFHERFQLFVQEGAEQNTPLFTLVPLKDGFYSLEFSSTINHLQAFFICVAVLSSQKLPSSLEMNNIHEDFIKEFSSKNNELQGKAPLNYNPVPPLSPVDRV
ncbi:hypothetical protein RJT34_17489 [Clitoria ternatea]|uniref:Uncharacterized protein n=1 Tax=Clitoria ternatea TaxID=43366 RepID=A0AAN9J926_CLITE